MAYRVLFFGTAAFSVPLLKGLANDSRFELIGVVTQPDRPVGRKGVLTPPPTKVTAEALGVPVFQFENVKEPEVIDQLNNLAPDILAVASFGQIMPKALLQIASRGAINFHWSLLPKYRGASPIQASLLAGDEKTGATVMLMDTKMDHGAILATRDEPISSTDTSDTLYHRLGEKGASWFPETIADYLEGRLQPQEQDHAQATFVKLLSREDGRLDPEQKTSLELERMVRAYTPWPGTYLDRAGKRYKILEAELGPSTSLVAGTPFIQNGLPAIACKEGTSLLLSTLQPEGKAAMDGAAFLRGRADWN